MRARLVRREELVKNFWQMEFESAGQTINFEPGQFFNLTLINPSQTDERGNSRYFGFTTTPGKPTFEMLMENGVSAFKKTLLQLAPGSEVEIDKIGGENNIAKNPQGQIVFIAGGIGIAPVISMIRYYFEKNLTNNLTLIYTNDNNDVLPFIEELTKYSQQNPNFKLITAKDLDENLIRSNFPNPNNFLFFIRGEKRFVLPAFELLKTLNIEAGKISIEIFTGY